MRRPLLALLLLAVAPAARAEIALLRNGMTLKVAAWASDGGAGVHFLLKDGGQVSLPGGLVAGVVPDEVVEQVQEEARRVGGDLESLLKKAAERHGLDPALVRAVVSVESAFRTDAVSVKGAQGLMQLMPQTAAALGVKNAFDPEQNLDGGTRHLAALVQSYGGDLKRALAAYNAGAGAVQRHGGVPPFPETRDYVSKVMKRYRNGS
jgi:hypothetical protein